MRTGITIYLLQTHFRFLSVEQIELIVNRILGQVLCYASNMFHCVDVFCWVFTMVVVSSNVQII